MWRELIDPVGWRYAGQAEFSFVTRAIATVGGIGLLRVTVASLGVTMLPVAVLAEFMPSAPTTPALRVLHMVAAVLGAVIGALWIVRPWPTAAQAIQFLAAADVLLGIGIAVLGEPEHRLAGASLFAMLGLYAAFLLGWRVLLVHCVYSLALVLGIVYYGVVVDGRSVALLAPFAVPTMIIAVGVPVLVQAVVELCRVGVNRVASEWYIDSLTGLLNRRGMDAWTKRVASKRSRSDSIYISAVADLDGFKAYNDTYGHFEGDELLASVGARLDRALPQTLVSRNGGDEFGVFAVCLTPDDAARRLARLTALIAPRGDHDGDGITASLGIVVAPASYRDRIRELATEADAAQYEAKRSATRSVVVHDLTGLFEHSAGPSEADTGEGFPE
ncbi:MULTISPECIES: GGDEF domain-containing protein [Tsukamurella]|uniref:GGDEF domain-containing protein n=1 Tax=Tsukamurella strandjordii TaxID=147577 RepID=A0AA90N8C8_9ACTN|nr:MULTISPECIES: GGDEF domain-containing protein [Tsukamurella]MDP0397471.1 GGDEF domain-containing protein [Tsukamurella strandjordii]GIZ98908.1 hypothetical protein TTY48_35200 [Tsukamurella sp. TY48]